MAGEGTAQIGYQEDYPPGGVPEEIRKNNLKSNAEQDNAKSPWIPADQGPDLRVFMNDFLGSRLMRLTLHTPPEAVRLGHTCWFELQI